MRRTEPGERGRLERAPHESSLLRDNVLGDPHVREVGVYLPAEYERDSGRRFPVLYSLAGFTGSGLGQLNWKNFGENVPERLDRLIGSSMGPVIVVFPDAFTSLGGNQYVDSEAIGPYASWLTREIVPWIDERYRTLARAEHRGVFGKSSGGYGAMVHGMRYPEVWGGVACHSGDLYFEYAYRRDFPLALDGLARHGGTVESFLEEFRSREKQKGDDIHTLMLIAMAASYDPDPAAPHRVRLPFDLETGEIDEDRWQAWLEHDPLRMVESRVEALKGLQALHVECGTRDQYYLHYGARMLHRRLRALEVPHTYFEFDDDHSGLDYRFDVSLPILERALRGPG